MKIVVAIDSFKGCLTSAEAASSAAEGIRKVFPDADVLTVKVSDGGEGFLDAVHTAIGGELVAVPVSDPLGRTVVARYLLKERLAIIEIAQASGLTLLSETERNPLIATSYGTGLLVANAVGRGAEEVIIGLGGSATSDAGVGMLQALIDAFSRHHDDNQTIPCQWDGMDALANVRFTIATDVSNPLCGQWGAAHVFAPQKGATPQMVTLLDERAKTFAEISARHFGYDCSNAAGAGAAGGLGYAFMQYLHAACRPGIEMLLDTIHFTQLVKDADLIITGEGAADRQTLMGKLPMGILGHAEGIPVCLIAGRINDKERLLQAGFARVECINPPGISTEEAMKKATAQENISQTVSRMVREILSTSASTASK